MRLCFAEDPRKFWLLLCLEQNERCWSVMIDGQTENIPVSKLIIVIIKMLESGKGSRFTTTKFLGSSNFTDTGKIKDKYFTEYVLNICLYTPCQ